MNSERVTFHLLTRDEDGAPQNPLEIEGKSLGREVSVLRSWMEPSGRFDEIQSNDIENVEYNLGLKCGMCIRQFECFETANAPLDVSGLTSSKLLALPAFVDEQLRHENLESLEDLSQADEEILSQLQRQPGFSLVANDLPIRAQALIDGRNSNLRARNLSSPCYSSLASWPDSPLSSPSTRVFLHISYDFADDRTNGLAAHVTNRRSRYRIRHRNGQTQERISSTEWSPIDDNHSVNISLSLRGPKR